MNPNLPSAAGCSDSATAGRATASALSRPLAVALLLSSLLLAACGGGGGSDPAASADAKTPQIRCAP